MKGRVEVAGEKSMRRMNATDSEVLKDVFGIQCLREDQKVVIQAVRSGSDAVVVMRTGGG
jgi:superfamily II DNA helicase RecQ